MVVVDKDNHHGKNYQLASVIKQIAVKTCMYKQTTQVCSFVELFNTDIKVNGYYNVTSKYRSGKFAANTKNTEDTDVSYLVCVCDLGYLYMYICI